MKTDKLAKDLTEDKETLKRCLENTKELKGWYSPDIWYRKDETILTVAHILESYGQLTTAKETIDFFEKPYNFEDRMRFIVEEM